jgi:hypothetical protein
MTLVFSHLNSQTSPLVEKPLLEREKWVREDHFVYYPKAQACLDQLNWVFEQGTFNKGDFASDLEGMTIIGDHGAGKTAIYREFRRRHPPEHSASKEGYPVAYCMLKDSITGLKGLYSAVLSAYGHPYGDPALLKMERITIDQLEEVLIYTLKETKTQLLFIDEFQHARGKNQQAILNQLKRTMLVSRVPFVPMGTPNVMSVLNSDPQLADRCPVKDYSTLELWPFGTDFRQFLGGYEQFLPFPEPTGLSSKDLASLIFEKVEFQDGPDGGKTNLRRISRFLKKVSVRALRNNHNHILEEDVCDTNN